MECRCEFRTVLAGTRLGRAERKDVSEVPLPPSKKQEHARPRSASKKHFLELHFRHSAGAGTESQPTAAAVMNTSTVASCLLPAWTGNRDSPATRREMRAHVAYRESVSNGGRLLATSPLANRRCNEPHRT